MAFFALLLLLHPYYKNMCCRAASMVILIYWWRRQILLMFSRPTLQYKLSIKVVETVVERIYFYISICINYVKLTVLNIVICRCQEGAFFWESVNWTRVFSLLLLYALFAWAVSLHRLLLLFAILCNTWANIAVLIYSLRHFTSGHTGNTIMHFSIRN